MLGSNALLGVVKTCVPHSGGSFLHYCCTTFDMALWDGLDATVKTREACKDYSSSQEVLCETTTKINENEVPCKLRQVKLAYHKSTATMHSQLRLKHKGEGEGPFTDQQSMARFGTRQVSDGRRAKQTIALTSKTIAKDLFSINLLKTRVFVVCWQKFTVPSRKNIAEKLNGSPPLSFCVCVCVCVGRGEILEEWANSSQ